jgi:hypothetical protein
MVSGILSPFSSILKMIKCPAFLLLAIYGASITNLATFSERNSFSIILNIVLNIAINKN